MVETKLGRIVDDTDGIEKQLRLRKASIRPINERVSRLREESVHLEIKISSERARLITEFYREENAEGESVPVRRALAFRYLMENVSLPIEEGQLIVGLRGTGVNEVPTFPEINVHSVDDLLVLDERENMPYRVDDDTKELYRKEIIPFWKNTAIRDRIFEKLPKGWINAYEAGVWTEFMEQRAPGHTAGGERIFRTGIQDIREAIKQKIASLTSDVPDYSARLDELRAMDIAADAILIYAHRYSEELKKRAEMETDPGRKSELLQMAEICKRVPAHAPSTFWEALQHYWFIHVGITYETNPWDCFTPGRLDQHLYDLFSRDLLEGNLSTERAKELLQSFWVKFNAQPAVPKVGVTAEESFTYNDFAKINFGGLKEDGTDGVNDLSYLILDVLKEMRTLQPNTAALISNKNADRFLFEALEGVGPGFGEPPIFNFDQIVVNKLRQGKRIEDSRTSGVSGCVESGSFGKETYVLTGYINLPKILEVTMNNGKDPRTGKTIGKKTGDPLGMKTYEEFWSAYLEQIRYFMDIKMWGNDFIEEMYSEQLPVPFLSIWIDDCVKNAKDYNSGGSRYNTQYVQIVGLGTVADSCAAIKQHVFEKKTFTMSELLTSLKDNFDGHTIMWELLKNPAKTPKLGNDEPVADDIASSTVNSVIEMIESYPESPVRKASKRAYFLPTTAHVYFGKVTGATPDGRVAGFAVSEGISPVQGMDRKGIATVFRSISKLDWEKSGGALLNQKLTPDIFSDEDNITKLSQLIRTFFRMGGYHVQFNVVTAELLKEAQAHPADFQDLMVRVAGYSDYFVNLPKGLQEEIIARTEQESL